MAIKRWFVSLPKFRRVIAIITILLVAGSVVKSIYYTVNYGGVDLRERIVGARMIPLHKSPYLDRWSPGQSERLIDPNLKRQDSLNGVTVAPGSLYILYLFSGLSYFSIRILWMFFQYACLAYIFLYFFFNTDDSRKFLVLVISSVFFFSSSFWFLHIERGQMYIFYAFLFTLAYQFCSKQKKLGFFLTGFTMALAIYCRPNFVVLTSLFLFIQNRWLLFGFISCSFLLLTDVYYHLNWWREYTYAMSVFTGFTERTITYPTIYKFPLVIEGMNNLTRYKTDFNCGGIRPIDHWVERFIHPASYLYLVTYTFVAALLLLTFKNRLKEPGAVFLFCFGLYIISEYIMPAPRSAYNLIQWIFPVLLLLKENFLTPVRLALLIVGLFLITDYPFHLPLLNDFGEFLLLLCLFSSLSMKPFSNNQREKYDLAS
jgi:hypothetical protein